ncbi:MAG: prepilin-type N-terminal cleavage/methylation domain-containing protein [Gemmatimonadales bacterium]
MSRRTGFTLVELLMGLIIMGIVSLALTRVFLSQQRLTVTQVEQASMQANVRTGTLILANELREIGNNVTGGNDIKSFGPTSLTYRAMRSVALACGVTAGGVRIRQTPIYGARPITAGRDSMLLFVEHSVGTTSDDEWYKMPINGITVSTCLTADSAPAYRLATTGPPNPADVRLDAPLRTFEVMEIGPVVQGGHNWLGARSVSAGESLTPVAGPITLSGLAFSYLDENGNATGNRSNIRSIRIVLRGQTDWSVRPGNGLTAPSQPLLDSLVTIVTLRNQRLP